MFKKCSIFHWCILRSFNFIEIVYELFDNPSYMIYPINEPNLVKYRTAFKLKCIYFVDFREWLIFFFTKHAFVMSTHIKDNWFKCCNIQFINLALFYRGFFHTYIFSNLTHLHYGDSRGSRAPCISAYEILLQHDWLLLGGFASCFEINVFYFTNLNKLFFQIMKHFSYITFYFLFFLDIIGSQNHIATYNFHIK